MSHRNVVRVAAGAAIAAAALWATAMPASAARGSLADRGAGGHVGDDHVRHRARLRGQSAHEGRDRGARRGDRRGPGTRAQRVDPFRGGWGRHVEGGPQPAHEAIEFGVVVTFPDAADTTVGFPTVETCEERHGQLDRPRGRGPGRPSSRCRRSPSPRTHRPAQLAPAEEDEDAGQAEDAHGEAATTTAAPAEDGSSNTGMLIGVAVVVVVVAGVAALLVRRRRT